MEALKKKFKPEFLNRIDATIVFEPLSEDQIKQIAKIMIDSLNKKLSAKNILLSFTKRAIDEIVRIGFDKIYGARPLKRVLEQKIEDKLAEEMLAGKVVEGDTLSVDFDKEFILKKKI